jgi:NTP pyrophosphatase (non-canonical NTP hydrolase)
LINGREAQQFVNSWYHVRNALHTNSITHGFWTPDQANPLAKIALTHAELSEALEAIRNHRPMSDHIPDHELLTEELADTHIRLMDLEAWYELPVAQAILAKHEYNLTRPYRHGKTS